MVMSIFVVIATIGILALTTGAFLISEKKATRRKYVYPLLLFGGVCLEIYSIYIQDTVFIILQGIYIVVNTYGWFRVHHRKKKN